MGSTDSSCCGSQCGPPRPETDSAYLKQHRSNQLNSTTNGQYTITTTSTTEECHEPHTTPNMDAKQQCAPSPSPTPHSTVSSADEGSSNNYLNNGHNHHSHRTKNGHKRKKKRKYNKVKTQIEILASDNARNKSLLLCSKPEKIQSNGGSKEFGFLKYLETNLSENAVAELFSKFPAKSPHDQHDENSLSVSQFISILTLAVIIYQVKLHQLRTGTKEKPSLNSEKIKSSVEHLAVWCIRTYGDKQHDRKHVKVYDDDGEVIEGDFYIYKFRLTQKDFSQNIYQWLTKYVDESGKYELD